LADAVGVGDGAKVVDSGQLEARDRESPIASAGGDQQLIEFEPLAARQSERALLRVDAGDLRGKSQLDIALAIEVRRSQQGLLERRHTPKVVLGQGRPVVGRLRLGADEHHSPVQAFLTQGRGGGRAREARADDGDRRHQNSTCRSFPWTRTGYTLMGTVAGGASTAPVRMSNSAKWHGHTTAILLSSPSASEQSSWL